MGRVNALLLIFALGAGAALGLSACGSGGSGDLLPGRTASEITSNLDRVSELSAEGECIGAEESAQEVSTQIDALGGVDKQLKLALREGAERLNEVVAECQEVEAEEPEIQTAEELPEAKPAKPEKQKKPKPAKEEPEPETQHTLPPQANGEGKGLEDGQGEGEGPPAETTPVEPSSGGVGPGTPAGGE